MGFLSPSSEPIIGGEPLMSVTRIFPAVRNHCPLAGTKLYCLATEARCVNNLCRVTLDSGAAGIRTQDHFDCKFSNLPLRHRARQFLHNSHCVFFQCFDTVGLVTGNIAGQQQILHQQCPTVLLWNTYRGPGQTRSYLWKNKPLLEQIAKVLAVCVRYPEV